LRTTIGSIEVKDPFLAAGSQQLNDRLATGLKTSGFLKPDEALNGHRAQVAWIQNAGSTIEPREAKPIKQALNHLFAEAKPGDTILLRNNAFNGTAQQQVADAIKRGVNVKILAPTRTKVNDAALLFKDIQAVKNKVDALPTQSKAGKLEVHVFNPNQTFRDAHDFDPGGRPVNDHAKVYALKRANPSEPSLLLTGTHNLDGQSFKRSHENVMFMESTDTHLTDSLFDEFWEATPEMTKQDIDLLVTDFKKPRGTPSAQWAEQIQGKAALLEKIGLAK
jgi:phosphatidylserine/phosphatidylglycerophosphate/cardiolipin synthase-like enzyme